MALTPGTRLGVYEVTAQIGEGGMGEVYQATDTKLKRQVAIKVLPASVAADTERLARFQREAEVLASLNHPNIAIIHGLEQTGDVHALVMELVEGDDLSQRIARGAIPVDEALPIAKQIAEALEAAHEQGIIHRDLKPANIKVRPDGTVKVLDFGLAKALEPTSAMSPGMSQAPTITTPAMTQAGMILGTAAYMSPEQAKGRTVDKRSDVWAFGAVLHEMITGQRAFGGDGVSETLAKVIEGEPDFEALPEGVPARVRQTLRVCLRKDHKQRVGDIRDVRLALEGAFDTDGPQATASIVASQPTVWRRPVPVAVAASLLTAVVVGLAVWGVRPESQPASPGARFVLSASPSPPLAIAGFGRDVAISPDGARVVYTSGSPTQLYVRAIDQLEGTVLPGTVGAAHPLFSPDGDWIVFGTPNLLMKVSLSGGSAVTLSPAIGFRGASWVNDDTIVFATTAGVFRVPAAGGEATPLLLSEGEFARPRFWPEVLPGGRAVLFTNVSGDTGSRAIFLLDLETLEERSLFLGVSPRYSPTGHIVYAVDGTLLAVPFDLDRLEVTGGPVPVVEGVVTKALGVADFDLASDGSLVYVGGSSGGVREVVWVDRDGRETPMPGVPPDAYRDVRVSPDGTRVAIATQEDVWTYDVGRATLSRLTTHPANDRSPLWSPDGSQVVFTSDRGGRSELFWRRADGTGDDNPLLARAETLIDLLAHDWSPDGRHLVFGAVTPQIACDLGQVAIADGSEATMLVESAFCDQYAAVSPDGRWIAYDSNLLGPDGDLRWAVSGSQRSAADLVRGRAPSALVGGWRRVVLRRSRQPADAVCLRSSGRRARGGPSGSVVREGAPFSYHGVASL